MPTDEVTEEQYNWSIEQTLAVMPTMRQHLERAEQRGYDRAIAEVVAWLRGGTNVIGLTQEVADRIVTYLECVELPAIKAGEHKP